MEIATKVDVGHWFAMAVFLFILTKRLLSETAHFVHIGFSEQSDKLVFAEVSLGFEQHCHSEPVRLSGVGISIEFRAAYRHTACSNLPFLGIHPREMVLLSGRLPHQSADWFAMTGFLTGSNAVSPFGLTAFFVKTAAGGFRRR